ncbi:MAG: type II toxin-antitoxin system PemK/MazF family toxin [Campylobacterales bacterium]
MTFEQYEVVLVNLDPTIGSEIKKTRPCVVLSPNEMNHHIRTLIVAPMTSTLRPYPSRVKADKDSFIALDQIRTVDKQRVIKRLDRLPDEVTMQLKTVIKEMLVD